MTQRVLSVRIPEQQLTALETVARFDGVALAEEIRAGIDLLLEARRGDEAFKQRVREAFDDARALLDGVEGADAVVQSLKTPESALGEPLEAAESGVGVAAASSI